jgi:ABC-type glycerol-3-phosphate transport system permease component
MFQKREIIEYGLITAATTCVTIPVLIAYLFFRKQIVRTTVLSGLKS